MRKILFVLIALLTLLVGCEKATKTIYNIEFVESIKTSRGEILQFKDSDGYKLNYFVSSETSFEVEKEKKYDVAITVEDILTSRDFVYSVKKR